MNETYNLLFNNLKNNNILPIFANSKEEVKNIVEDLLFEGASVSNGGSVSIAQCGIFDLLKSGKYNYYDRNKEGITQEEKFEVYKKVVGCDFYFCSSNAITKNGELINVDGNSNRISAISFGPKKVIMIVGKNKLVNDVKEGLLRIKKTAAPKNCERLNIDNPCRKLGHCISLTKSDDPSMTEGCNCETRICRNYLISSKQMEKDRIILVFVDENLGY